jgi:hypothetical protein
MILCFPVSCCYDILILILVPFNFVPFLHSIDSWSHWATMTGHGGEPNNNTLNSVLDDIRASTGSPFAQPPAVEQGWDEHTRIVSAHGNSGRGSNLSGFSEKTSFELWDWERYYADASSQDGSARVLSPPSRAEASRQLKSQESKKESSEEYPKGLQLALIILGVCLSVYIIALNRQIVSTVCTIASHFPPSPS